ncbi:MAG: YitT family protein [Bacillus sp. (in: firmicutes)]
MIVNVQHKGMSIKNIIKRGILITLGALLMAIGLEVFLVPNQVIDGGITGISIILSSMTNVKLGIFIFLLNVPFVYIGYKQIGRTFAYSTMYGITVLSVCTFLLHKVPVFTHDVLLASVFGGIFIGVGIGLVIRYGGSMDGTEILAILVSRNLPFSVGELIMLCNVFILGSAGFIFGWNSTMYSLIAYFIAFKTIDVVIQGLEESKSAWIISERHLEIGEAILARLGRGVTYFRGEGAYTGEEKKVIFCVITRLEEAKLKAIIEELDPDAFLAVASISEVRGGHFKKQAIH